ncbi:MAG: glycosyltransferase family 2 protein [Candidatus Riflebacteria bacterium]|nr:glycosyltransferase family 2 protein [Candidatus Riflebacteria bacterium]
MIDIPRISIVSPCYNQGEYVNEMLDSVFSSTFDSFEIIIVDDGSDRCTRKKLDSIYHKKVKIIHIPNKGPSFARNTGITEAKGEIILNLDIDDKITSTFLEKAYAVFNTHSNIGIVTAEVEFFGARSGKFHLNSYSLEEMLKSNLIHSTACFKKSDWKKVGGYSNDFPYGLEDYDFWLSILELKREVFRIPEPLIYYRKYKSKRQCRSGRLKESRKQNILSSLALFRRHEQLYAKIPYEYQRMSQLKKKWENENIFVRELKEIFHYFRGYFKT